MVSVNPTVTLKTLSLNPSGSQLQPHVSFMPCLSVLFAEALMEFGLFLFNNLVCPVEVILSEIYFKHGAGPD